MKEVFCEALNNVRPLNGEIRFFGSLWKTIFQEIPRKIGKFFWEFREFDSLKERCNMRHMFHNVPPPTFKIR